MPDAVAIYVGAVFILAGFVKGVIGVGLPTIAVGLLAVVITPIEAAAILIAPSLATNVWQMVVGSHLVALLRRLWPMMLAICIGTWVSLGFVGSMTSRYATVLLGVALVLYAAAGLANLTLSLRRDREAILGPIAGCLTGAITAATGVFVMPAVPYLQAIGLSRDELVQALGLSFTVSTAALAVNLVVAEAIHTDMAWTTIIALAFACVGMAIGQLVRGRLDPVVFRHIFFAGLLLLGLYLTIR